MRDILKHSIRLIALAVIVFVGFTTKPAPVAAYVESAGCNPQHQCNVCYPSMCDQGCNFNGVTEHNFCHWSCGGSQVWWSLNECFG